MQVDFNYDELLELRQALGNRINQEGIQSTDMFILLKCLEKVVRAMDALNATGSVT